MEKQNIIGPNIRKIRVSRDWTQEILAAKCNLLGWDISRGTLSKIEAQIRKVSDYELVVLARALRVDPSDLIPKRIIGLKDLLESNY